MSTFNNFEPPFDLNAFAQEHHAAMVAKGFWEGEFNIYQKANLIGEEIGELVSAHRAGKRVDDEKCQTATGFDADHFNTFYQMSVKGTMEEELADIVLRTLDLAGHSKEEIQPVSRWQSRRKSFHEIVNHIIHQSCQIPHDRPYGFRLEHIVYLCAELSESLGIDLWLHVQLKKEYNASRAYKHGKSY